MIVYGTDLCPDCLACKKAFDEKGIVYEYRHFNQSTGVIKEFLKIRDTNPLFDPVRKEGNIGIPCIVLDDGCVTLDWESLLEK